MEASLISKDYSNDELIKIKPIDLLTKMKSRGWVFDELLKSQIQLTEKKIQKENILINESDNINILLDINLELLLSFKLFYCLTDYNIDPIPYILIFLTLSEKNIKNLYRYIAVKWLRIKNKYRSSNIMPQEILYTFQDIFKSGNNFSKDKVQIKFLEIMIGFIKNNKINIIFLVNVMQEYLCPIV